jgi:hypothetical protein
MVEVPKPETLTVGPLVWHTRSGIEPDMVPRTLQVAGQDRTFQLLPGYVE